MHDSSMVLLLDLVRALIVVLAGSLLYSQRTLLVRQPDVVGEMTSGVLLGPTLRLESAHTG